MILSAVSLWKKFNTQSPLNASEWGEKQVKNASFSHIAYSGHAALDGSVRIYAEFAKPADEGKYPAVLLLNDVGKPLDQELLSYFAEKGYAVLMPDYTGKSVKDEENTPRTIYPPSLAYANYDMARGLDELGELSPEETCWFEWTYVALYSIEYLKSREDISSIGVVGIRTGGEIAWKTMLSPDVKCGVPINAAGWRSSRNFAKFGDTADINLSDERHRYIAGIESQSYAPFVKCPVLMLCALRDHSFDCDRAYDTFSRIGNKDGNAIVYSPETGSCIGPDGITDMDLFLEKNLKGREIYLPDALGVSVKDTEKGLLVEIEGDEEGLLDEIGVYYSEADVKTKSTHREWQQVYKESGTTAKDGKVSFEIVPYAGASAVFVYAYAKYFNGFKITSKITTRKFPENTSSTVRNRMLFSGDKIDCFGVADYEEYSVGGIFMEKETVPKLVTGYGKIKGAYSVGGIKTYLISSPQYIPDENALLEFDAYFKKDGQLWISVDTADVEAGEQRYSCLLPVKGGGKWKRIILKATDFKNEELNTPLSSFAKGKSLLFDCEEEDGEYAITNILWL